MGERSHARKKRWIAAMKKEKSGAGFPHISPEEAGKKRKKASTGSTRVLLLDFIGKVWVLAPGCHSGHIVSSHIPSPQGRIDQRYLTFFHTLSHIPNQDFGL